MPKEFETRVEVVCGEKITTTYYRGAWHMTKSPPRVTTVPYVEKTVVEAVARNFPQRAAEKLVKRGGRKKIVRSNQSGKSLKKIYQEIEKAAAMRVVYRNRKGCEQISGPTTADKSASAVALEALGAALKAPCIHQKPCRWCD